MTYISFDLETDFVLQENQDKIDGSSRTASLSKTCTLFSNGNLSTTVFQLWVFPN